MYAASQYRCCRASSAELCYEDAGVIPEWEALAAQPLTLSAHTCCCFRLPCNGKCHAITITNSWFQWWKAGKRSGGCVSFEQARWWEQLAVQTVRRQRSILVIPQRRLGKIAEYSDLRLLSVQGSDSHLQVQARFYTHGRHMFLMLLSCSFQ